jgi:hypothetical protein
LFTPFFCCCEKFFKKQIVIFSFTHAQLPSFGETNKNEKNIFIHFVLCSLSRTFASRKRMTYMAKKTKDIRLVDNSAETVLFAS